MRTGIMGTRRVFAGLALVLLGAAVVARADAQADDTPQTVEISIQNYRFHPPRAAIKSGTTVKWINNEKLTSHSVLFAAERLESDRLFPGESWQRRFDKPGQYVYGCGPHPEMSGVIDVAE